MVLAGFAKLRYFVVALAGLLALEALCLSLLRHNMQAGWVVVFSFYFLFYGLFPITLDVWRIRRSVSLRLHWILWLISVLINFVALMWRGAIFLNLVPDRTPNPTGINYTDLLVVLAMAPTLILLSLPNGKPYPRAFFWIDSIQMVLLIYLVYLKLFGVIPFTNQAVHPVSAQTLIIVMATCDVFMLILAILRYFGSLTQDERMFYLVMSLAGAVNIVLITTYNKVAGVSDYATYYDLLVALSSYIGLGLILSLPLESIERGTVDRSSRVAEILNIVCPAFFTLALLAIGIDATRRYFVFGIAAIAVTFVLHMIRSTILQKIYESSQYALKTAHDTLETLSLTDALTHIANRRCFDHTLKRKWDRAIRTDEPLSLMMVDLDYFKHLNDRYGHQAGDNCLVRVAGALRKCLPRSDDLLARYGGEEFAVILSATGIDEAQILAAEMQAAMRMLMIENESPIGLHATLSIGIATSNSSIHSDPLQLVTAADKALYRAKASGRNRIEIAKDPSLQHPG